MNVPETLPTTQTAVQLVGPDVLRLNTDKPVPRPTGHQILCRVEATGLCFSDLKLLKQFQDHPRKTPIVSGMSEADLASCPSYVVGEAPTVPGHEAVVRIVAVGDAVQEHKVGERCLVQSDYRALKTAGRSNAAFGYNFEGALQEYVIIDERVSRDHETGERLLLPAPEDKSASSIGLVEPWACVEDSYVNPERQTILAGGRLLVIVEAGRAPEGLEASLSPEGKPAEVTALCADRSATEALRAIFGQVVEADDLASLPDLAYDDVVVFGSDKATLETVNSKLANQCIVNIVTGGKAIGAPVAIGVGRIHYGCTRWVGTTGTDASASYRVIPPNGELRPHDRIAVVGAGGPMGQMHVLRNVCAPFEGLSMVATDFDDDRLASLAEKAEPMARERGVDLQIVNPQQTPIDTLRFTYSAIMVPVAPLVAQAVRQADPGCIINIFAGIPAPTIHEIDLDAVIEKGIFIFGTSGSVLEDMKIVLSKVISGALNTDLSVDAISGMAGAIQGIRAVENRTLAGKIMVYPALKETGLIPLPQLEAVYPSVAARLENGHWTKAAEEELLAVAK